MFRVGNATITPVFELEGGQVIQDGIPDATPEAVKQIAWLRPNYADENGKLKAQVQAFIIVVGGKTIFVDGCCGDGRERPGLPEWGHLNTGFMNRLKLVCTPEAVDIVLCTHMHFDHVGWNTTQVAGEWLPTFPNAQYIFVEDEFNYWKDDPAAEMADDHLGFHESILPVYEAGRAKLVPSDYQVLPELSFVPTPGHTPGHVSIQIESAGERAILSGDALHHPCQAAHPEWGSPFDTNTDQANQSRRVLLDRCVDTDALLIGAHFAEPVAVKLVRDGEGFRFV